MDEKTTIKTTFGDKASVFYTEKDGKAYVYAVYDENAKKYLSLKDMTYALKRVIKLMGFTLALYSVKKLNEMGV